MSAGARAAGPAPGSPPGLAVVIPAGPADDLEDTLDSVLCFTTPPRVLVVVDDTGRAATRQLGGRSPDVVVLSKGGGRAGLRGKLWGNIAAGIAWVVRNAAFDVLLRMDADALMLGPGIATLAAERFAADPTLGLLGSYRTGMDGGTRDWTWAAAALGRECGLVGLRQPALRRTLRELRARALSNGYIPGAHPLGGAYLLSRAAAVALEVQGLLELHELEESRLGEDHLCGLLAFAAGFRLGDFAGPEDPLALDWKGLPASPAELLARQKLVTHSVRRWGSLGEAEIRAYFARARSAFATSPEGPKPR